MSILTNAEIEEIFIDYGNKDLWNKLSNKYTILVNDDNLIYELKYINNDPYTVILTNKNYSKELFTHELLHLDLRYKGLNTVNFFESLSEPYIETMAIMVLNCIEHILFFDDYIELGYSKDRFVMDYNNSEYKIDDLKKIYSKLKSLNQKNILVLFITYAFWVLKSEDYIGVDRDADLEWLRKTSPIQFAKCEKMFDEIIDFEIEGDNVQLRFEKLMRKYLKRNY